ncbi:unnamed protein product [Caenorhabditis angaria]|uniref:Uncharacterized protein n=1 Tax=Caenorhabditis angaria TaxID=860376 RepID=A0A9P1IV49_9PELO|nr:unnamed protein product [Caenorhabditis angaria]
MFRAIIRARPVKQFVECRAAYSTPESIIDFVDSVAETSESQNKSFASLLRHSKFMQLGDFNGRLVVGKIAQRIQDDLYIDFGLKFNAVCKAPSVGSESYRSGARVLIRLLDPELSERFLGSNKDLTLLEADAVLVRLLSNTNIARKPKVPAEKEADKPEIPAE